jgi:uncharacterized membrane protein YhaH (DUF805 family)
MTDPPQKPKARKKWVRGPGPKRNASWIWALVILIPMAGNLWTAIETAAAGSVDIRALVLFIVGIVILAVAAWAALRRRKQNRDSEREA